MSDAGSPDRARASGPGRFETTHWSVVLAAAQSESPEAEGALETLCQRYWYPLYAWLRRKGRSPHEAEDMTQEFFSSRIVTRLIFKGIHPDEGRFRTWLLASLQNLLLNQHDRRHAQKRGGGRPHVPLECQDAEARYSMELAHDLTPEKLYERAWALTLLKHTLTELRGHYERSGRGELFLELKHFLPGALSRRPHAEVAARLGKSEEAVKMAISRLKQDYGRVLREEIQRTVSSAEEAQAELRHLLAILSE